jgi:transcription termination/antitermination protein NusG
MSTTPTQSAAPAKPGAKPVATVQWYVIRAVTGQEKKIKQYLESEIARLKLTNYVNEILIPMEKVFEMRNGKKRTREKNHYPGYIMMQAIMQPEVIQLVRETTNVIGFAGKGKDAPPIPMRESEINRMLGKVDELSEQGETMENPYSRGESVKVMDGPFNGFSGVVEEVDEAKKKLKVTVKIFGRNTPLELNYLQVERG